MAAKRLFLVFYYYFNAILFVKVGFGTNIFFSFNITHSYDFLHIIFICRMKNITKQPNFSRKTDQRYAVGRYPVTDWANQLSVDRSPHISLRVYCKVHCARWTSLIIHNCISRLPLLRNLIGTPVVATSVFSVIALLL